MEQLDDTARLRQEQGAYEGCLLLPMRGENSQLLAQSSRLAGMLPVGLKYLLASVRETNPGLASSGFASYPHKKEGAQVMHWAGGKES